MKHTFPKQEYKRNGWTISTDYLQKMADLLDSKAYGSEMNDEIPSWEQIEMVLLAVEELELREANPKTTELPSEAAADE